MATDGTVTSALAEACDHVWGGGAVPLVPTRLLECLVEKSAARELAPRCPHDAAHALQLLLDHLVTDVRRARAGDQAWLDPWLQHMKPKWHETTVCRGRACTAAGVRPRCRSLDGDEDPGPIVPVDVLRDDGTPTDLATLLAQRGAIKRCGADPICNGKNCGKCRPTDVRCPCTAQHCGGKIVAHTLQPFHTRRGDA